MAYDNPKGIIAASVILELLAVACVGLRFFARRKTKAPLATDDWLIFAALIFATALTVMEIYGVAIGVFGYPLGHGIADPKAVMGRANKAKHLELAAIAVGIPTLGLIKLSVSFLYRRIFTKPIFKYIINTWIVLLALWTIGFELAGLLECGSKLKALFGTPQDYLEHCSSAIPAGYAMVGSDVGSDIITLIIPIPMIWTLQMPLHRKILLAAMFMIGLLSVGAGIGKAYIYVEASLGIYNMDGILTITAFSVWNLVEVQVGIIAACGALLRPVFGSLFSTDSIAAWVNSVRHRVSSGGRRSGDLEKLPRHVKHTGNVDYSSSDEELVRASHSLKRPGEIYVTRELRVERA